MDTNYIYYKFPTYGYLTKQFTKIDLNPLLTEIDFIKNNFNNSENINNKLAGQIERQFKINDSKKHLEKILLPFALEYNRIFNYFKTFKCLSTIPDLILDEVWVNFQKKYEYNPPHDHSGVLSFVIWINIPYLSSEEKKFSPGYDSVSPKSGNFEFFYTNNINGISVETIDISKDKELTFIIFPSTFVHQVYPFYTSNDYRISVSGNFKFHIN
jgi:hypothetical protein